MVHMSSYHSYSIYLHHSFSRCRDSKEMGAHVVVLPFPAQGHINPLLQFAKLLASKGLKVTLATTVFITKSIHQPDTTPVLIQAFSDGCDEGGMAEAGTAEAYGERFRDIGSKNLSKLIQTHGTSEHPVKCIVYDSHVTWGLDVAKQLGLIGASYFTQSCAVGAVYYSVQRGLLSVPVEGTTVSLPGLPLLRRHELPSFIDDIESYPVFLHAVLNQFSNVDEADWILFNTFDILEDEIITWMAKRWPAKMLTVGPTVPSLKLDNHIKHNNDYGFNLLQPDSSTCINWLNTKDTKSVVYVAFGSLASLGEDQMEELAWGLKNSGSNFLWVVRPSEEQKLPKEFEKLKSDRGLVVTWCPQLEVLAHQSVGCFMTHCGWNSTLEALSLGVPMVAMPQWTDQTTNAKFVEDVWRVGVRVAKMDDENGIVRREEIEKCIREILEGEKGELVKRNALKWKELVKKAVCKGGSSDKNVENFVATLISN